MAACGQLALKDADNSGLTVIGKGLQESASTGTT
jgi:hypothetical protein